MQIPTKRVRVRESGHEVTINASDFDARVHDELDAPESDNIDTTPGPVSTVNSEEALALIDRASSLDELDRLEEDERSSKRNKGGRKNVLKAIAARREELGG